MEKFLEYGFANLSFSLLTHLQVNKNLKFCSQNVQVKLLNYFYIFGWRKVLDYLLKMYA